MKRIINKYIASLVFPRYNLYLESNEIKSVTDEQFDGVINNAFIEEVLSEAKKDIKSENKEQIGSKKKIYKNK